MKAVLPGVLAGALMVSAVPATAADLPSRPVFKAPVAVAPAFSWTGFYVGGNLGYAWGNQASGLGIVDGTGSSCHFVCGIASNDLLAVQAAGSSSFKPSGFGGGGQFGYNLQATNWVYGVEVDFGAFRQRQTITTNGVSLAANTLGNNCTVSPCTGNFSSSMQADWLLTLRPRIGFAWERSLIYATGGLALTHLSFSQSYRDNVDFFSGTGGSESATASKTVMGWTVGGGVEQALTNNWSMKAEYLYTRFDGLNATGQLTDGAGGVATFTNNIGTFSSNIVRGGVNYRF
jgi:outer membrane immunogenic protein